MGLLVCFGICPRTFLTALYNGRRVFEFIDYRTYPNYSIKTAEGHTALLSETCRRAFCVFMSLLASGGMGQRKIKSVSHFSSRTLAEEHNLKLRDSHRMYVSRRYRIHLLGIHDPRSSIRCLPQPIREKHRMTHRRIVVVCSLLEWQVEVWPIL